MADVLFITEDFLKKSTTINENIDSKIIHSTIIMCQDIYIQKKLGTALYNDLKTKITANPSLSSYPDEKNLIDNYISKPLCLYVKMELYPELKFQNANKGIQVKSSDNSQSAETSDLKYLMTEFKIKAERYSQLLTDYLCLNTALFPKYTDSNIEGMAPVIKNYTNNIFLND